MERGWIAPSPSQATGSQSFPYPFTSLFWVSNRKTISRILFSCQISLEIPCFSRAAFQYAEVSPQHHFFPCLLANTTQYFKNPVISGDSHSRKVWAHGFFFNAVWSHMSIANNFIADSNYTVHYTSEGLHKHWFRLNKISVFTT